MAPKNSKTAPGHDDVSGLFARLGTQASEGYQDFAHSQLPPRKPGAIETGAPIVFEQSAVAVDIAPPPALPVTPALTPTHVPSALPAVQSPLSAHAPAPVDAAANPAADALAPLRKLRQLDEPAPRGLQSVDRPAQTPLERLFQRLLQADARSSAHSPLKRLRSR